MKNNKTSISITQFNKKNQLNIDEYNFANFFQIVDCGQKSYFNISKTLNFINMDKVSPEYYGIYEVRQYDTWTNISFKHYNTYKLWWLICKFNNIVNPFTQLIPGSYIKIPKESFVRDIIRLLKA